MNRTIEKIQESYARKDLPAFNPGDTVRVHVRLREGEGDKEKERIQPFEGVVISRRGRLTTATFTVRRVSFGVGVERIFPLLSPSISTIELAKSAAPSSITCESARARPHASSTPTAQAKARPTPANKPRVTNKLIWQPHGSIIQRLPFFFGPSSVHSSPPRPQRTAASPTPCARIAPVREDD
jgi:large subunit ribosomal protein L19